jgi:hypothetical protein
MPSSSKTLQPCAPEVSIESSSTLTASGLMRRGRLFPLPPPSFAVDSSCWPSPTVSDHNASRRHGYMFTGHSGTTLTDAMLEWYGLAESKEPPRVLNPDFCEALLGMPEGWTSVVDESACAALETPSLQIRLF